MSKTSLPPVGDEFREITKELLRQIEILAMISEKAAEYSELDLCEHFNNISLATIRRDLKALRSLGLSVHTERGVVCFTHNLKDRAVKKNYLALLNQLISLYISINEKENIRNLRGIFKRFGNRTLIMFVKIIRSINSNRIIRVAYGKLDNGDTKFYEVTPIGFNRTQHSFHLIGLNNDEPGNVRFFLFERISDVEFTNRVSVNKEIPTLRDLYKYTWANFTGGEVEEVELLFDNSLNEYFSEKIFLEEQEIIETDEGILVKFKVGISYEFTSWLLGWGGKVKVLKPNRLRETIINRAKDVLKIYS